MENWLESPNPFIDNFESNEFEFFPNESPFPMHLLSSPLSNETEYNYNQFSKQSTLNEPPLSFNGYSSNESGNTEITNQQNQININSPFMPTIEPWRSNQSSTNYHDNSSSYYAR